MLAQEYANRLGVKLEPVAVSHETKVPILASGQVDMTIAPLSETDQRKKDRRLRHLLQFQPLHVRQGRQSEAEGH